MSQGTKSVVGVHSYQHGATGCDVLGARLTATWATFIGNMAALSTPTACHLVQYAKDIDDK